MVRKILVSNGIYSVNKFKIKDMVLVKGKEHSLCQK